MLIGAMAIMIIFIVNSLTYPCLLATSIALALCISGLTTVSLTTHISNPLFLLTLNFLTTTAHLKLCFRVSSTNQPSPHQTNGWHRQAQLGSVLKNSIAQRYHKTYALCLVSYAYTLLPFHRTTTKNPYQPL